MRSTMARYSNWAAVVGVASKVNRVNIKNYELHAELRNEREENAALANTCNRALALVKDLQQTVDDLNFLLEALVEEIDTLPGGTEAKHRVRQKVNEYQREMQLQRQRQRQRQKEEGKEKS